MTLHFPTASSNTFFSLGGYTCVRPGAWRQHLIHLAGGRLAAPQPEQNDCVLRSLEEYLFFEFGVFVPRETLFPYYNPDGEGVAAQRMVEAICAIVEPLGFEIDRILVADAGLRQAMGGPPLCVDSSQAAYFDGKPGICMINIKPGYSHAFYWDKMDASRFQEDRFRMAVMLRPRDGQPRSRSALAALLQYAEVAAGWAGSDPAQDALKAELARWSEWAKVSGAQATPEDWACVEASLEDRLAGCSGAGLAERSEQDRFVLQLGEILLRVLASQAKPAAG